MTIGKRTLMAYAGLDSRRASVRVAHSVTLQAKVGGVRHGVCSHVVLWEDGVRGMSDAQPLLVNDEIDAMRHPTAPLTRSFAPIWCRRDLAAG